MSVRTTRRVSLHLIAIGAILSLVACAGGASPLEPKAARHIEASSRSNDDPPDLPCRSGWEQTDGGWVCSDPG